jgi:hypothetical protein
MPTMSFLATIMVFSGAAFFALLICVSRILIKKIHREDVRQKDKEIDIGMINRVLANVALIKLASMGFAFSLVGLGFAFLLIGFGKLYELLEKILQAIKTLQAIP